MKALFYLSAFLITYGSFFPFEFESVDLTDEVMAEFWASWSIVSSRGDILSNVVLFIPFGLLGMLARNPRGSATGQLVNLLLAGGALAFLLQVGQLWLPYRSPELQDVVWNTLGLLMGAVPLLNANLEQRLLRLEQQVSVSFPLILIGAWLAALWVPFVPTLDLQAVKDSLKPLLLTPEFELGQTLLHFAAWLTAISLWQTLGRGWPDVKHAYWLLPASLLAQLFLVGGRLTVAEVLGGLLALGVHALWKTRYEQRAKMLLVMLALAYALDGITPWVSGSQSFLWIPFEGFLTGSMLGNAQVLMEKFFLFGSLLWLARSVKISWEKAAGGLAALVFLVELLQSFQVAHTPEITDVLYVLALAIYLRPRWDMATEQRSQANASHRQAAREERTQVAEARDAYVSPAQRREARKQAVQMNPRPEAIELSPEDEAVLAAARSRLPKRPAGPDAKQRRKRALILLGIGVLALALPMRLLLELPGVPYNVREMFSGGGSIFFIAFFALAVAWNGAGSAYAGRWLSTRYPVWLAVPAAAFGMGLISYVLVKIGLSNETVTDITGSANLNYYMIDKQIWGSFGAALFGFLNSDFVIPMLEKLVRYLALVGPLFIILVAMQAGAYKSRELGRSGGWNYFFTYMLYALPWLLLCKYIAFDASSTDNLNELIARPGDFGLGGGGFLYALVVLLAGNAVWLGWAMHSGRRALVPAALMTLAFIPLGWWLLNLGLVTDFNKYGTSYSGVDFLLGPDRKTLLSTEMLMLRWTVVQLAVVVSIAWGIRVFHMDQPPPAVRFEKFRVPGSKRKRGKRRRRSSRRSEEDGRSRRSQQAATPEES